MESSTAEFLVAATACARMPIMLRNLPCSGNVLIQEANRELCAKNKYQGERFAFALVTPKGAPRLALCHAKVTREQASSKLQDQVPRKKLM